MKSFTKYIAFFILALVLTSCTTTATGISAEKVASLVASKNFTFVAEKANPTDQTVIGIMNSLPGNTGRNFTLDPGYQVEFTESTMKSNLPFFGRNYQPNLNPLKSGYTFESKNFTVKEVPTKKNKTTLQYNVNDVTEVRQIYVEIFPNGRAYLSINSGTRQPISYDGYITETSSK